MTLSSGIAFASEPVRHPLLTDEALALVAAHPELSPEELLARLEWYDEVVESEDGSWASRSGVRFRDRQTTALPEASSRPARVATIDDVAASWLTGEAGDEPVEGWVAFARADDGWVSVPHQQALAMLRGEVQTEHDLMAVRLEAVATRRALGEAALAEALGSAIASGAELLETSPEVVAARLRAEPAVWRALSTRDDVVLLQGHVGDVVEDSAGHAVSVDGRALDGVEIQDLLQTVPFYLAGFRGMAGEELLGMAEPNAHQVHNQHLSFRNTAGDRRVYTCVGWPCQFPSIAAGLGHPTSVSSILVSDLTLGQDPAIVAPVERRKRSGIARDSSLFTMGGNSFANVVSMLTTLPIFIANYSAGQPADDPMCRGQDLRSRQANALYTSGIAFIDSAGNYYHDVGHGKSVPPNASGRWDCTVASPGSAIGVFTVGAWGVDPLPANDEFVASASSRGGTNIEGLGRSIMDLLGPTGHAMRAMPNATDNPQYHPSTQQFGVTSAAAPAVAGSAMVFRSWYRGVQGNLVDDPGILFANLLLMGDGVREGSGLTTHLREGYDGLTGAGRLRLRSFDAAGLDGPAQWLTGSACVGMGQSHDIVLNGGNPLPANAKYIKAATWWYDAGHELGDPIDTYELSLRRHDAPVIAPAVDNSNDNKQRVFQYDNVALIPWRVRISPVNVTSIGASGCNPYENRVYYAILWEDNRRDDDVTLETYVRPEPAGD